DRRQTSPVIVLSCTGLYDRRLLARELPWSDIERATITYGRGGISGVLLRLRKPLDAWHNPFRLGTLGFVLRRRSWGLYVGLMPLDEGGYRLAHCIARLVKRHGGEAVTEFSHPVFVWPSRKGDRPAP